MMRPDMDRLLVCFSWGCAMVLVSGLAAIMGFLLINGWHTLGPALVFGSTPALDALLLRQQVFNGLFPAMAGSLCLVLLSVAIALPFGIGTGIFLAEYAPKGVRALIGFLVDLLAGIPSIVVGLFGFSLTVFLHQQLDSRITPCLLISALSLAFLVLPYLVKSTQDALADLGPALRLTAPSLGATRTENIFYVLLPAAFSDILSGIVLAVGRCAEDTAVIMLTGAVASAGLPNSLFSGFEALPFYIFYIASEYSGPDELARGYGAALILLLICTALFGLAHALKRWAAPHAR